MNPQLFFQFDCFLVSLLLLLLLFSFFFGFQFECGSYFFPNELLIQNNKSNAEHSNIERPHQSGFLVFVRFFGLLSKGLVDFNILAFAISCHAIVLIASHNGKISFSINVLVLSIIVNESIYFPIELAHFFFSRQMTHPMGERAKLEQLPKMAPQQTQPMIRKNQQPMITKSEEMSL